MSQLSVSLVGCRDYTSVACLLIQAWIQIMHSCSWIRSRHLASFPATLSRFRISQRAWWSVQNEDLVPSRPESRSKIAQTTVCRSRCVVCRLLPPSFIVLDPCPIDLPILSSWLRNNIYLIRRSHAPVSMFHCRSFLGRVSISEVTSLSWTVRQVVSFFFPLFHFLGCVVRNNAVTRDAIREKSGTIRRNTIQRPMKKQSSIY